MRIGEPAWRTPGMVRAEGSRFRLREKVSAPAVVSFEGKLVTKDALRLNFLG